MTAVVEAEATESAEATETETKEPGKRGRKPESRDFTEWREDHESLAKYINENTNPSLDITPGQVKAVFLLRGEWSDTPERKAEREAAKQAAAEAKAERDKKRAEREAEKAKYANETEEEKAARKEREKVQKQADRAAARAAELAAKAEELRKAAGLDEEGTTEAESATKTEAEPQVEVQAEETPEVADEPVFQEAEAKPARRRKRPVASE